MATQLQIRRGTASQIAAFTGAEGEVVVNTTNDSIVVSDGSTAGGFEQARADLNNVSDASLNAALTGNTVSALTITTLTLGSTAITATGAEINILDGVTATAAELNILDGVTATTAELNHVDGVTSAIQTQLDAKAPLASPTFTGTVTTAALTGTSATFTTADNTTQLTLASTDADSAVGPILDLFRNSATPGNFDLLGKVLFSGEDSGGNKTEYAHFQAYPQVVTDGSESGYFEIHSMVGGTDRVRMEANATEVVINNPGIDSDFRVESVGNTHALFVEGSTSNVGIGGVPNISSSSGTGILTVKNTGTNRAVREMQMATATSTGIYAQENFYNGSTLSTLIQHGGDGSTDSGYIKFFTKETGANISEKFRITSAGAVGIGTVPSGFLTSGYNLRLNGGTQTYLAFNNNTHTTQVVGGFVIGTDSTAARITQRENNPIIVATNDAERMRINATGSLLCGATSAINNAHTFTKTQNNTAVAIDNKVSSGNTFGLQVRFSANDPNDAISTFVEGFSGSGLTQRFSLMSNGGLRNYQSNNVNLCDERVKRDISPLSSMWSKFKALEIVSFKYKDQSHTNDNIGVIAQQVESVAPEFVDNNGFGETPEGEDPLKTIFTTDLYHAAIKALQEAMTRIETLEAKLQQLEQN